MSYRLIVPNSSFGPIGRIVLRDPDRYGPNEVVEPVGPQGPKRELQRTSVTTRSWDRSTSSTSPSFLHPVRLFLRNENDSSFSTVSSLHRPKGRWGSVSGPLTNGNQTQSSVHPFSVAPSLLPSGLDQSRVPSSLVPVVADSLWSQNNRPYFPTPYPLITDPFLVTDTVPRNLSRGDTSSPSRSAEQSLPDVPWCVTSCHRDRTLESEVKTSQGPSTTTATGSLCWNS